MVKQLIPVFLPAVLTLLAMLIDFSFLPENIDRYPEPFFIAVMIVWAFYFPENPHKSNYRWWVLGPVLAIIIMFNINDGGLPDTALLWKKIAGIAASLIALIAYYFRGRTYPVAEDSTINASRKVRRASAIVGLIGLAGAHVAIQFNDPLPGGPDTTSPAMWMVLSISALTIAAIAYYIEAVYATIRPSEDLIEKIDSIGENEKLRN